MSSGGKPVAPLGRRTPSLPADVAAPGMAGGLPAGVAAPAVHLPGDGPRVVVVDNYDSFTYNLVQYLAELGAEVLVFRNDALTVDELARLAADRIVLSPGPGTPERAGICIKVIRRLAGRVPILGVCLGHQAIGAAYGGRVVRAPELMHGKTSLIHHRGTPLYAGVDNPFEATRYHSLVVERESLPACLEVTAETADGLIMGLRHRSLAVEGVQFHPESILTRPGKRILANFLGAASRSGGGSAGEARGAATGRAPRGAPESGPGGGGERP